MYIASLPKHAAALHAFYVFSICMNSKRSYDVHNAEDLELKMSDTAG